MNNITKLLLIGSISVASMPTALAFDLYKDADTELSFSGRLQARYNTYQDGSSMWDTGSTRWGLYAKQGINTDLEVVAGSEWTVTANEENYDDDPHVHQRLLYAGLDHDRYGKLVFGQQLSVVWDVAWWTDLGRNYGGRAFGMYNYADFGEVSGTGRGEKALTWRNDFGDWKLGLQYQGKRSDAKLAPGVKADLGAGGGASLSYSLSEHVEVGAAYYQNRYNDTTPGYGVSSGDDAQLWLAGLLYLDDNWHAAMTLAQSNNWEVAENGQVFDSQGVQTYLYHHFENGLRPTFNYNWLEDTDGRSGGEKRHTYIYGLEYHFSREKFLIWGEYQDNHGTTWSGSSYEDSDDEWTAGIRYYF